MLLSRLDKRHLSPPAIGAVLGGWTMFLRF
jgi:hypothetical protein